MTFFPIEIKTASLHHPLSHLVKDTTLKILRFMSYQLSTLDDTKLQQNSPKER